MDVDVYTSTLCAGSVASSVCEENARLFFRSHTVKSLSYRFAVIDSSLRPRSRFVPVTSTDNAPRPPLVPLVRNFTHTQDEWASCTLFMFKFHCYRLHTNPPLAHIPKANTNTPAGMGCVSSKSDQLTPLTPLPPPRVRPRPLQQPPPIPWATKPLPSRVLPPMPRAPKPRYPPPNASRAAYYATNRMPQGPIRRKPVAMDRYVNRPLPPLPVGRGARPKVRFA